MDRPVLTYAAVLVAARLAYEEERLTAQNGGECRYIQELNGKQCGCAVGVALPQPTLDRIVETQNNHETIYALGDAFFMFSSNEDRAQIGHLQNYHDAWAHRPDDINRRVAFEALLHA